jgi:serine phosphatase RsbU (regulator of sigma subunit)
MIMASNPIMCPGCAGKISLSSDELISRWIDGLKGFSPQLPPELQHEILNVILNELVETLKSPEPRDLGICGRDDPCESLHEYGHLMARKGYSIDEILRRFALLQDVVWDFLASFLRNEVYPVGREYQERLIDEHGGCHRKISLFFRNMTGAISRAYVEEMETIVLEKDSELKSKELEIAGNIMRALIPLSTPLIPGIDLEGRVVSANIVGGDFWEASCDTRGSLEIVLGDVMGHGIPAALLVSMIKYLHMAYRGHNISMSRKMEKVNRIILRDTPEEVFITSLYTRLDFRKRTLFYVSAGYPPPLLLRNGAIRELGETDIPLGLIADGTFRTQSLRLKDGDIILMLSDGVIGARNARKEFMGIERIRDFMSFRQALPAKTLCESIIERTKRFCGGKRCDDDITVVVVKMLDLDAAREACSTATHPH